ncbi:MAG: alpha/beta fold hydrolase [Streptosporangiaceae bacterium]
MSWFVSYDGTRIGYLEVGDGAPLVCLPGGPGRTVEYFGDLGGLGRSRRLIMVDTRGTGESGDPQDPASFRCDRLVGDVEALRVHLGLERMDLLGHSAAGNLAALYASMHPERLSHLILLTPGLHAVGIEETREQWHAALGRRSAEPWYPDAMAALERAAAGDDSMENRRGYSGLVPEGDGDRAAGGRALPVARRCGLLHRRDRRLPQLNSGRPIQSGVTQGSDSSADRQDGARRYRRC